MVNITKSEVNKLDINKLDELINKLYNCNVINGPVLTISTRLESILQVGPKCGLVAISMASTLYGEHVPVETLLNEGRRLGVTNHGEMFSASFMVQLIQATIPGCQAEIITSQTFAEPRFVANCIARGYLLLVPYDSDRNFTPACLKGHKAHWALIIGVIIQITGQQEPILHLTPSENTLTMLNSLNVNNILVIALQGKSKYMAGWSLPDLVNSNNNLLEVDPERVDSELEYVVPEEGIDQCLQGKVVLMKPK